MNSPNTPIIQPPCAHPSHVHAVTPARSATHRPSSTRQTTVDVHQAVVEHAPFVGRSLRYLGVNDSDVEDAAQEVFIIVLQRLETFEGRSALRTWLYGVCVRVAAARRRRARVRRERIVSRPPESMVEPTQDAHLRKMEARRRLRRVLDELDEAQREVFVLYEIERRPMKEIAEVLGCPLQTAYYRLHAARKTLMEAFASVE